MSNIDKGFIISNLGASEGVSVDCPVCEGGVHKDRRTLGIWRAGTAIIAACKRASCDAFQKIPSYQTDVPVTVPPALTPFTGTQVDPDDDFKSDFEQYFGFAMPPSIGVTYDEYMVIPIEGPLGRIRGHVVRRPHWWTRRVDDGPKSRIYKAADEPMIGHMRGWMAERSKALILVEDPISAYKIRWWTPFDSCFLNGTNLSSAMVAEIQRRYQEIVLALDPDATSQAFDLARRWGSAFKSCTVKIMAKDPKDMTKEELQQDFDCVPVVPQVIWQGSLS